MNILLDTHALIWFVEGNDLLSIRARYHIEDSENQVHVSMVSFYEMAIKLKTGKLGLSKSLKEYFALMTKHNIVILGISASHLFAYDDVPLIDTHRDPFDRLIIATAITEKLPIITVDNQFAHYKNLVEIIW